MKVVVSGYVGKKITGIGRNLLSLLKRTNPANEYVVYVNQDMEKEFYGLPDNISIKTYSKSKDDSLGNLLWTAFVFPFKARKEGADVALIPNFALVLIKLIPTAVIMHDLIEFNVPNKFSKLKMFYRTKLADPIMAKRADRIMTVSDSSKQDIMNYLHVQEGKIEVIPCGVDRNVFHRLDEPECDSVLVKFGIKKPFILYAGTIDHPGKNSYSLLKAFEKSYKMGQFRNLILAGMPGSGYEFVQDAIKDSPCNDSIILTGYVSDDELTALYSACDVFCFPSLYEGFGMPPLEALACGAKVVVSKTSSLPEVVGDVGIKVDPLDIDELTEALEDASKLELDSAKVTQHLQRFDWGLLAKQFEEYLERTIRSTKDRSCGDRS